MARCASSVLGVRKLVLSDFGVERNELLLSLTALAILHRSRVRKHNLVFQLAMDRRQSLLVIVRRTGHVFRHFFYVRSAARLDILLVLAKSLT